MSDLRKARKEILFFWHLRGPTPRLDGAACVGVDPNIFFSNTNEKLAKGHCSLCPVKIECLKWAVDRGEAGVWGGTNQRERSLLRKRLGLPPRTYS